MKNTITKIAGMATAVVLAVTGCAVPRNMNSSLEGTPALVTKLYQPACGTEKMAKFDPERFGNGKYLEYACLPDDLASILKPGKKVLWEDYTSKIRETCPRDTSDLKWQGCYHVGDMSSFGESSVAIDLSDFPVNGIMTLPMKPSCEQLQQQMPGYQCEEPSNKIILYKGEELNGR